MPIYPWDVIESAARECGGVKLVFARSVEAQPLLMSMRDDGGNGNGVLAICNDSRLAALRRQGGSVQWAGRGGSFAPSLGCGEY